MIGVARRRVMGGSGAPEEIIMTTETNPEVLAICYAQGWCAHADYMTKREAEAVTDIGTAFDGSNILHFEEFVYFTSVTTLNHYAFRNVTMTGTLTIPPNVTTFRNYVFMSATIRKIVLSEGIVGGFVWHVLYYPTFSYLSLPSTMTVIPNCCKNNLAERRDVVIHGDAVIPLGEQSYYNTSRPLYFYVKDSLVNAYKADSSWASINPDNILPVSQYSEN